MYTTQFEQAKNQYPKQWQALQSGNQDMIDHFVNVLDPKGKDHAEVRTWVINNLDRDTAVARLPLTAAGVPAIRDAIEARITTVKLRLRKLEKIQLLDSVQNIQLSDNQHLLGVLELTLKRVPKL